LSKAYKRTHLPAFLLLFLRESSDYGAGLLAKLKAELPYFLSDRSNVYRTLQEMEEGGLVSTNWKISSDDTPRKWYTITPEGLHALESYADDIIQRHANLSYFINLYSS